MCIILLKYCAHNFSISYATCKLAKVFTQQVLWFLCCYFIWNFVLAQVSLLSTHVFQVTLFCCLYSGKCLVCSFTTHLLLSLFVLWITTTFTSFYFHMCFVKSVKELPWICIAGIYYCVLILLTVLRNFTNVFATGIFTVYYHNCLLYVHITSLEINALIFCKADVLFTK